MFRYQNNYLKIIFQTMVSLLESFDTIIKLEINTLNFYKEHKEKLPQKLCGTRQSLVFLWVQKNFQMSHFGT